MFQTQLCSEFKTFAGDLANKKAEYSEDISELLLIQQQTDLLHEIMKNALTGKKSQTLSTEYSDFSLEMGENTHHFNMSISGIDFGRQQSKFFEEQSLEEALKQIRKLCSRKTYNFVRDKFRTTEDNRKDNRLEKEIRYNQQLIKRCMKLTHQVNDLKAKLQAAEKNKVMEVRSPRASQNLNLQRGQAFLKWEKAMLHKEKMHFDVKKNLNKQFTVLEEQKKQNENLREDIQNLLTKIQQFGGSNNPEVKQLVQIIKPTIQEQRRLSQQQVQDYKKTQQQVDSIINQLKSSVGME